MEPERQSQTIHPPRAADPAPDLRAAIADLAPCAEPDAEIAPALTAWRIDKGVWR